MLEIIKEIVTEWDPIGLMGFAPSDEYDDECCLIFNEFVKMQEPLGEIMYKVFKDNFGEVFQADMEECLEAAAEIESRVSKDEKRDMPIG